MKLIFTKSGNKIYVKAFQVSKHLFIIGHIITNFKNYILRRIEEFHNYVYIIIFEIILKNE